MTAIETGPTAACSPDRPDRFDLVTVPAGGRATLDGAGTFLPFPGRPDGRLNALLVDSIGDTPVPIVAERSIYANELDVV